MISKLSQRILSALILGPVALILIYLGGVFFAGLLLVCFVLCGYEWTKLWKKIGNPFILIFGFFYLAIAFFQFFMLRLTGNFWMEFIPMIIAVWLSDISGYFFGKNFGKIRPFPNVSPNKTWAGFLGAILAPGIVFQIYKISDPIAFIVGCLIGILGQVGDLVISALKRKADVKDTGAIIPGHGGLLDRIDSLLFVSIFYPLILNIVQVLL